MEASRPCPKCGASMKPRGLAFCAGIVLLEEGRGAWECPNCGYVEVD